jgi:hypothetical protein
MEFSGAGMASRLGLLLEARGGRLAVDVDEPVSSAMPYGLFRTIE